METDSQLLIDSEQMEAPAAGRPPAGEVLLTFLFTDIQGSTQLWEHHAPSMEPALARHDTLLRQAIEAAGGRVFKTVGDAFCAVFGAPVPALQASIAAQEAVAAEDWSAFGEGFPPLRVRMAVHTGTASTREGDYFGPTLNRVARLEAAGHGGQILVSLVTQQLVRDRLLGGVTLRELGEHRLKDLQHTEQIFQVVSPGMPDIELPLRTADRVSAHHRILVDEAAGQRSLPESLGLLYDAVRDETRTVSMSPDQLREVARHAPANLTEYRLGRVAHWSQPQYRIDGRFVDLALLIDQGEETGGGRWRVREEVYHDLGELIDRVPDPALVVLGPPGSGKSTLLRRVELDAALAALRSEREDDRVTFYVELNHFKPPHEGEPLPAPHAWLAQTWAARFPDLPGIDTWLGAGRATLLLDALNEMPATDEAEFHLAIRLWKDFIHRTVQRAPRNRIIFSCRSLDYSAPLSTPDLRVPQVRIEPMSDAQVLEFIRLYSPLRWRDIWEALQGAPQLELLRSPYFLKLLVEQVDELGEFPRGRAALLTGFARQALRREVERDNPLFRPGRLLSSRDVRRLAQWSWRTPWELPSNGVLIPKLFDLAYAMQAARADGKASRSRLNYDAVLDVLDDERDEDIVRAGLALSVLDEDTINEDVLYIHPLVQEYFAAQHLAQRSDAVQDLVRAPWSRAEVRPTLEAALGMIAPADPLPPLPASGWEPTAILAAAMTPDPEGFVARIMDSNLALAGQCACQPDVPLSEALRERLCQALVVRSRDPEADLRARIDAALALGRLGDPRFPRSSGPHGAYLLPPLVALPAGRYVIGRDDDLVADEAPRHSLDLAAFSLGQFPVTNAEWALFMAAGGYDDVRWWDSEAALAWQRGEGTAEGIRSGLRLWRGRYLEDPGLLDRRLATGHIDEERYSQWRHRLSLDDAAFEALLVHEYPGGRRTEPRFWHDERFNHPAQPVVGVSWFEAWAYCNWLAAQTGRPFRLPSEAEWEAATRGAAGRRYAFGDEPEPLCSNTIEARVRRPTPIGVFPPGDTPEGLADMTGNVWEWTLSLFGRRQDHAEFGYPYRPADGREDPQAGAGLVRIARGGSWYHDLDAAQATTRYTFYPDGSSFAVGFRVAL